MTDKEFLVETLKSEIPIFDRVLRALPENPEDLRHHPKNKNAKETAEGMALETAALPGMLRTGVLDFSKIEKNKGHVHDVADSLKKSLEESLKLAEDMDEADWNSPAKMMIGGKAEWESTKGHMLWGMLFDLIHHRGQISTYIRPHGGKVPSIYGPSGDMNG